MGQQRGRGPGPAETGLERCGGRRDALHRADRWRWWCGNSAGSASGSSSSAAAASASPASASTGATPSGTAAADRERVRGCCGARSSSRSHPGHPARAKPARRAAAASCSRARATRPGPSQDADTSIDAVQPRTTRSAGRMAPAAAINAGDARLAARQPVCGRRSTPAGPSTGSTRRVPAGREHRPAGRPERDHARGGAAQVHRQHLSERPVLVPRRRAPASRRADTQGDATGGVIISWGGHRRRETGPW